MIKKTSLNSTPKISNAISLVLLILAIGYIATKSVFLNTDTIDFQFIWLAGHMWLNDLNPYSVEFKNLGQQLFIDTNVPEYWFYPPNWWFVSQLTAVFPYEISSKLWRIFSALLIIIGSALIIKSYYASRLAIQPLRASIFIFFVCVMYGTANMLSMGQTSAVIYFGLACFITAYLNGNRLVMILAITILMLKPHIGIVMCAFLLVSARWLPSVFWAAVVSIIISAPALKLAGVGSFLTEFTSQIHAHGLHPQNTSSAMTGLRHLIKDALNWKVSVLYLTGLGFASSFVLGWVTHRWSANEVIQKNNKVIALCLLISLVIFFVPLHSYDLLIIAPLIILISGFSPKVQLPVGMILLAFFHADNLTKLTGLFSEKVHPGNYLTSVVSLVLLIILVLLGYDQKAYARTLNK